MREELAELAVELRRQRLVLRQHQRRPLHALDDVGDRVGLARAGDAEQRLLRQPGLEALDQARDRLRLIAGGRIRRNQLEAGGMDQVIHSMARIDLCSGYRGRGGVFLPYGPQATADIKPAS